MTIRDADVSAPLLLWMDTRAAKWVATVFVGVTILSVPNYGHADPSLPLLIVAVSIVGIGIAVLMRTRSDPMSLRSAWAAGSCPPMAALVTAVAIPGPPATPGQTNALGAGVALCAFMCVRGRTGVAWVAQAATMSIVTAWGDWTGQGALAGFLLALPNIAVLLMSTLFARIMRPAALSVRALHAEAERQTAELADGEARAAERRRQNQRLQQLAWPTIDLLARKSTLTEEQIDDARLTEARLRDSVRAPSLDVPLVVEAVRQARQRGVDVVLIDDRGMDVVDDDGRTAFHQCAAEWLASAVDGRITVRVLPPNRSQLATIVAVAADGTQRQIGLSAAG